MYFNAGIIGITCIIAGSVALLLSSVLVWSYKRKKRFNINSNELTSVLLLFKDIYDHMQLQHFYSHRGACACFTCTVKFQ